MKFDKYWTVKEIKTYPWPCEPEPDRTFELHPGDVLTKCDDGSVTKHSGLGMCGLLVPHGDLVLVEKPVHLVG